MNTVRYTPNSAVTGVPACDMPCSGDATQVCGGAWSNSVWTDVPEPDGGPLPADAGAPVVDGGPTPVVDAGAPADAGALADAGGGDAGVD